MLERGKRRGKGGSIESHITILSGILYSQENHYLCCSLSEWFWYPLTCIGIRLTFYYCCAEVLTSMVMVGDVQQSTPSHKTLGNSTSLLCASFLLSNGITCSGFMYLFFGFYLEKSNHSPFLFLLYFANLTQFLPFLLLHLPPPR